MQFDFTRRTPQGQVQASGPRDQGTGIGAGSFQGLANMAYGVQDIAKQRVQEQAESDMSAFQAQRIKMEQDFRENSANITNAQEYRKAVDKYITDMDKYASGKRPDGTKVFRNGMGSSAYKEFSRDYSAKFKAQGSEHAFQLDRKRDKLNYRIAINGGINNTSGDPQIDEAAIIDNYEKLERDGHLTRQERIIEQERDIKAMTINRLNNQQAKILMTTEEILDRVNKEQMIFDGTGVKPRQDTMENAAKTIKGAFETYKAEVYTNNNLDETERKKLIDGAKSSLKYLESTKKIEYAAKKEAFEIEQANIHSSYMMAVAKNPSLITQIGNEYMDKHSNLSEKTLTQIQKNSVSAFQRAEKAKNDDNLKKLNRINDIRLRVSVISSQLKTSADYHAAVDVISNIEDDYLRAQTHKWLEDNKPGQEPKDPLLKGKMQALTKGLSKSLGLDLTRAQHDKLDKFQKYGIEDTLGPNFIPDVFFKDSMEMYVGGMGVYERMEKQNQIVQEYLEIYNKEGAIAADDYAKKMIDGINATNKKALFLNQNLKKTKSLIIRK